MINEQITALWWSAQIGYKTHRCDPEVVEKFAELIVQECMSALKQMHLYQSVNNQNYPNAWHEAVDQSVDTIKEHFGIEL